ncbi:MAG: hypothetical protein ABIE42_02490 [Candidatus Eisenbacteria bacterium]
MKWIISLACLALMFGIAVADETDEALLEVFVEVDANMTVAPGAPFIDLQSVQVGPITGYIPFIVDANTQTCMFYAAASRLYKGDDPISPEVPPIDLLEASGINFSVPDGDPTGGADNNACYMGDTVINGFPGKFCEWIEFESSQNNRFSQTMTLEVTWFQDNPEKPMGEYSGFVEFFAMIVLP